MSSLSSSMSKRARALAGATAVSLGGFAIGGFGGFRPASTYAASISPRSTGLCSIADTVTVYDDTDLQREVAASNDGDIICIAPTADDTITLSAPLVLDDTSLTLIGADDTHVVLQAPTNDRHIEATFNNSADDTLALVNLEFFGGDPTGGGGAVSVDYGDDLIATNVDFTNNTSSNGGGAIFVTGDDTIYLTGGTFTDNSADTGGAIYASNAVGLVASGTDFSNSVANRYGGAIYMYGPNAVLDITGGTIRDSRANFTGGAIFAPRASRLTVTDATFYENLTGGRGGAIYVRDSGAVLSLFGGVFRANRAYAGGAIYAKHPSSAVHTYGTTFSANAAYLIGGAVFTFGDVTAQYGTFDTNGALGGAGAIFSTGTTAVTNATFFGNQSGASSVAAIFAYDLSLSFVTSVDDSSTGGSVFSASTSLHVAGSIISPAVDGGVACSTLADDSSFDSFVTDSSCGSGDDTVTITTRSALGFDDTLVTDDSTGAMVLIPDDTSVLINAAPDDLVLGVTRDQLLATRGRAPDDSTTVGAVQVLPILFTTDPADATATTGTNATFTVAADPGVGTSPVDFQWQSSTDAGTSWSDIAGATSPTLTLNAVTASQNGLLVRAVASDLRTDAATSATAQLTVSSTPSPGPSPRPPSAPLAPVAVAGDRSAAVTWTAPASTGSFPITTYQVTNDTDGATCLLTVTEGTPLACTLTGLTNGTPYRFRVRALNGSGWGPWSDWTTPVTPEPPPVTKTLVITGTRGDVRGKPGVIVTGLATGLDGQPVTPWFKFPGQTTYTEGNARPTINDDGVFTWQRKTSKKIRIYVTADDTRSNTIVLKPE